MKQRQNTLTVHCGSMYSGKTSALIEDVKRFAIAGFKVVVYKPALDGRYSKTEVVTHDGKKIPAVISKGLNFLNVDEFDIIGIDEVQFFDFGVVNIIDELLAAGKTVVVAGLDMDYTGKPFEVTAYLMAKADKVVKHKGVCILCGAEGTFSLRTSEDNERIAVGGTEKYICTCRQCFHDNYKGNDYMKTQFEE